ncbi:MAG: hypothetical protein KI790_15365 [Cyclobacteriaceae bacterium]|nr:hypothetical protein [Cyclobacteriaceae bacterium HetDA_MAG_MS6]
MPLKKVQVNRRSLIRWKVYVDRARMYIGYVQFLMIGFVFLRSFEDHPYGRLIFDYLFISVPVLFILFILFSLILGYIDSKLGFREEELRNYSASNPILREIQEDIKLLRKELKALKK